MWTKSFKDELGKVANLESKAREAFERARLIEKTKKIIKEDPVSQVIHRGVIEKRAMDPLSAKNEKKQKRRGTAKGLGVTGAAMAGSGVVGQMISNPLAFSAASDADKLRDPKLFARVAKEMPKGVEMRDAHDIVKGKGVLKDLQRTLLSAVGPAYEPDTKSIINMKK